MSAIPQELLGLRVEVVRSIRRTAALHIVGSALQVRVPAQLGDERVAALLQQKRPWIRIKVQEGHAVGVCLSGGILRATVRPHEQEDQRRARIGQYLERWYRTRALERLQEKVDRYARQMDVSPAGVSVRAFRSRWGSCNKRGQVVFNWHIFKAPHAVVDYVVIHELAHLVHANHSRAFWLLVERHCPAFALHRLWLKERAHRLL